MLQVYDLQKSYGAEVALSGVTLSLKRGETVVIMGPSGCGKSTLLRCINRLIEPDAGEIWFDGRPVLGMSDNDLLAYRRRVGFVFQHFNLISRLTVLQNTALGLVMAGVPEDAALQASNDALLRVGIGASMHGRLPRELSGGQRQRLGIARALVGGPDLMLWDEPTASLDPILVQEVLEVMAGLVVTARAGMLIVTHELPFAMRLADRLILMDKGHIAEEGPPQRVFAAPASEVGHRYRKLWEARYAEPRRSVPARALPLAGSAVNVKKRAAG